MVSTQGELSGKWLRNILVDHIAETNDSQEKSINLPTTNFIGTIWIKCQATVLNADDDADMTTNNFLDVVKRIRIEGNSSAVICTLTGKELRNILARYYGELPRRQLTHKNGEYEQIEFPILFGRFYHDREYILPAKLFTDLKLYIDYNLSDVADPGWTTATFTIDVAIDQLVSSHSGEGVPFIRKREIETGTTKAGDILVDMPLGGAYKAIMVQSEDDDVDTGVSISKVKLSLDSETEVPFTRRWIDLEEDNKAELGLPQATLAGVVCKADTGTQITDLGTIESVVCMMEETFPGGTDGLSIGATHAGGTITFNVTEIDELDVAAEADIAPIQFIAKAKAAVPECVFIIFDKNSDMDLLLDSSKYNKVETVLTGVDTNATYSVCLEDVISISRG